jgi:hypothetical protein
MKHFLASIDASGDVAGFLARPDLQQAAGSASAILVQIFSGHMDVLRNESLTHQIQSLLPRAVVMGVSSGGEIAEGHVQVESTVLSLLCFFSTNLYPVLIDCHQGAEYAIGKAVGRHTMAINCRE